MQSHKTVQHLLSQIGLSGTILHISEPKFVLFGGPGHQGKSQIVDMINRINNPRPVRVLSHNIIGGSDRYNVSLTVEDIHQNIFTYKVSMANSKL